jgi:hypothetical protein
MMKMIVTAGGRLGPFSSLEQTAHGYLANGEVEYQASVIGAATVEDATADDLSPPMSSEALTALKGALANQVDDAVAAVYSRWLRFDAEYVAREAAARLLIADGTPSEWVSGFAGPAGLTDAAAAALIVQQADALRTALELLGAQRMRKYQVKAAVTEAAARAVANEVLAAVSTIAAGLQ